MTDQTPGRSSRRPHRGRRADEQTDNGPAQTSGADRDSARRFSSSTARTWVGARRDADPQSPASAESAERPRSAGSAVSAESASPEVSAAPEESASAQVASPEVASPEVASPEVASPEVTSPEAAPATVPEEPTPRRRGRRAGPPRDERAEMLAASQGERARDRRARRDHEHDDETDAWSSAGTGHHGGYQRRAGTSTPDEPPTTVLPPLDPPRTGVRLGSSSTVTPLGQRGPQESGAASAEEVEVDDAGQAPQGTPGAAAAAPGVAATTLAASDADRPAPVAPEPSAAAASAPSAPSGSSASSAPSAPPAPSGSSVPSASSADGTPRDASEDGVPAVAASAPDRARAAAGTSAAAGTVAGSSAAAGTGSGGSGGSGSSGSGSSSSGGSTGGFGGSGSGSGGSRAGGAGSGSGDDGSGPSRRDEPEGSLPRAAGWTVLTSVIPGTGLVTTPLRRLGLILLAIVVVLLGGAAIWFAVGDPLLSVLKFLSSRRVLIGLMVVIVVVALIWITQIVLSNLAHNTREGLTGRRRTISLVVALVMVIGVAIPFGRAEQYVYSAQGLLGNSKVFRASGGSGGGLGSGADAWEGKERVNIMLLGQDAGADRTGTRPDTIMVASIDTKTGRTALFSIPRNLQYVRFPEGTVAQKKFPEGFDYYGKDQNLINAVWSWANEKKELFPGDDDPGMTATTWAVEETLGLDVDYYAMVDLAGFSELVDAIGGVNMDVERKIPIGGGTNQATGGKYPIEGYIEPGEQKLNGEKALWYARSREGSTDFNRICRQQRMVRVVSEQANPTKLALNFTKLVGVAGSNIETNVPSDDLDAFVDLGWRVKDAGFASYPIQPGVDLPDRQRDGYFKGGHPDWAYLKKWVQKSIDDSMTTEEADSVSGTDDSSKGSSKESSESSTSATPSEAASPTETDSPSSGDASNDASKEAEKQAQADPLAACMPGTQDPNAQPDN